MQPLVAFGINVLHSCSLLHHSTWPPPNPAISSISSISRLRDVAWNRRTRKSPLRHASRRCTLRYRTTGRRTCCIDCIDCIEHVSRVGIGLLRFGYVFGEELKIFSVLCLLALNSAHAQSSTSYLVQGILSAQTWKKKRSIAAFCNQRFNRRCSQFLNCESFLRFCMRPHPLVQQCK